MSGADARSQAIQASYERAMKFLTAVGSTTEHKPPPAEIRWSNDGKSKDEVRQMIEK